MDQQKGDLQLITSQLKCFAYNIITENRMTRKRGGIACIYKDGLTVEKVKAEKRASFRLLSLKIKIVSHK